MQECDEMQEREMRAGCAKLACQPSYARREKRLHVNITHSGQVRVKLKSVSQPRPKHPGWWAADRTPSAYSHVASAFASGVDTPRVSLLSLSLPTTSPDLSELTDSWRQGCRGP